MSEVGKWIKAAESCVIPERKASWKAGCRIMMIDRYNEEIIIDAAKIIIMLKQNPELSTEEVLDRGDSGVHTSLTFSIVEKLVAKCSPRGVEFVRSIPGARKLMTDEELDKVDMKNKKFKSQKQNQGKKQ